MNIANRIAGRELRWPRKGATEPCILCGQLLRFEGRQRGRGRWEYHDCSYMARPVIERIGHD